MRILARSLLVLSLLPCALSCAHSTEAPPEPAEPVASEPASEPRGVKPSDAEQKLRGTVAEAFDAAGYTYLRVTLADGSEIWAAAPEQAIEVGSAVVLETSIKMQNFVSKALGRTFSEIYFVTVSSVGEAKAPPSDMI